MASLVAILADANPSSAAPDRTSGTAIFAATIGDVLARSVPVRTGERADQLAMLETDMAKASPTFFERLGEDITSGDPRRVSNALDRATDLADRVSASSRGRSVRRDIAQTVLDSVSIVVVDYDDQSSLPVEGDYFIAGRSVPSDFARERIGAVLARRYASHATAARD